MVWEAALLASKAKINVFQKQNLNGAVPIIWNLDIFSPFWRVVKLLYLVSAKGFLAYIARQGNTPHPIVEISTILQIEYLPNSF